MKKIITSLALVLAAGTSQAQLNNFSVGQTAPNFTVTDLHGHTHNLSDYAGKWVILDFFAYWCGPCAAVAPTVNDFYIKYGCNQYDIVVLGLEYEGTEAQTQAFEDANADETHPTPSASGLDGGAASVHSVYGPAAFPTIVLIGADGKFKNIDIWPISGVSTLENAVTSAGGGSALVVNSCALGVEEMTVDAQSLFPNPTTGNATINVNMPNAAKADVAVYSVSGDLISTTEAQLEGGANSVNISLNGLKAGTYFVRISSEGTTSATIPVTKQ
jgi:thiol-disulfide isomerase/thioredoxin